MVLRHHHDKRLLYNSGKVTDMIDSIAGVIFDMDGTLVRFNIDYTAIRVEIIQRLAQMGFDKSDFSINDGMFKIIEKAQQAVIKVGSAGPEEIRRLVFIIADQHEMTSALETGLIPGVRPTLRRMHEEGLKLAVCTIRGSRSTELLLRRLRIAAFFSAVVTRDEAPQVKPHPSHLSLVLERLALPPSRVILVGDGRSDVEMARAMGVLSVGVCSGLSTRSELESCGANYTIDSVRDLPDLMRSILEG